MAPDALLRSDDVVGIMPTTLIQPLKAVDAKKRIRLILAEGEVVFRNPYFSGRMQQRGITRQDVMNTLRAGVVGEAEAENREWRHQVRTARFTVVVCFPEEMVLATCTCWRSDK